MTTRLRAVEKQDGPADDFNNDITAGDAAADEFADAVTGALASNLHAEGPIKPARDWAEEQLSFAVKEEEELQREIAAAGAACDSVVGEAIKTRDAIVEKANLKLRRATGFRAALAIFKGELVKAEL